MAKSFVKSISLSKAYINEFLRKSRKPNSFTLEVTARCNNNCKHCYINLPSNDIQAAKKELSFVEIKDIVDQASDLGALWCLITGGEPLLRKDFFDIYLYLKKKGFLVSVFTNATLITKDHISLFKKYPPRDIEVTVYGVTSETYEKVTQRRGSFGKFIKGLDLLLKNDINVRFKTMALRSNLHELLEIKKFCLKRTKNFFRFDPFLHLRFDKNSKRNKDIKAERLSPEEIVNIERKDFERIQKLEDGCDKLILPEFKDINCNHLFLCGLGIRSFVVSYDGFFKLCSLLVHPECIYDLEKGNLLAAWENFVLQVRDMRSKEKEFLKKCRKCPIINLCMWCPAQAYLETGKLDKPVDYFCQLAHSRAYSIKSRLIS